MGFLGWIGSGIKSICKAVGSVVTSAVKVAGGITMGVERALKAIGGTIARLATKASGFLSSLTKTVAIILTPELGPLAPIIVSIVVDVVTALITSVLTPKGEEQMDPSEVEEYGALLAESEKHPEWKTAEAFNSGQAHLLYLKERVAEANIHIPKAKKLSVESLNRRILGMTALWEFLEKQERIEITPDFLVFAGLKGFGRDEFRAILDASKELGYTAVPYMDFQEGTMPLQEADQFNKVIVEKLRELKLEAGDDLTLTDVYNRVDAMQESLTEESLLVAAQSDLERYEGLGDELYSTEELAKEYKEYGLEDAYEKLESALDENKGM